MESLPNETPHRIAINRRSINAVASDGEKKYLIERDIINCLLLIIRQKSPPEASLERTTTNQ